MQIRKSWSDWLERRRTLKAAALAHRREMELKYGWKPPAPFGHPNPQSLSTNDSRTLSGLGFACGMFFLAVAGLGVGLAFAVGQSSPNEWVDAYLRLQEIVATRDLTASR